MTRKPNPIGYCTVVGRRISLLEYKSSKEQCNEVMLLDEWNLFYNEEDGDRRQSSVVRCLMMTLRDGA